MNELVIRTSKVPGKNNKHKVLMYAISTCVWCKRAKRFLTNHSVEFEYVDVDLCSIDELREIKDDILKRGGRLIYPTIIIDDRILMTNPSEKKLQEALESK